MVRNLCVLIFLIVVSFSTYADCVDLFESYFQALRTSHKSISDSPFTPNRYTMIKDNDGRTLILGQQADEKVLMMIARELVEVSNNKTVPEIIEYNKRIAIDISKYIDPEIEKILYGDPFSGPNCWNFACYTAGVIEGISFTSSREFNFLLKSPLAQELKSIDELKFGDIIALRSMDDEESMSEVHGATYITKNLWFNKSGKSHLATFEVADPIHVANKYAKYDADFMNGYRLKKIQVYIDENKNDIDEDVLGFYEELLVLQRSLHKFNTDKGRNVMESMKVFDQLETLKSELDSYLELNQTVDKQRVANKFLRDYIQLRIESMLLPIQ